MIWDLLQWIIGIDLALMVPVFAMTAMLQKRVTVRRIREIASSCVEKINTELSASSLTEETKTNLEHHVRRIIHEAEPTFSCFSDVSLLLLTASFWTFSAFISHTIAAMVYRFLNPTVTEGFVFTATFVCAVLYFVNAVVFLLSQGTWFLLFSYVTLKEVDNA